MNSYLEGFIAGARAFYGAGHNARISPELKDRYIAEHWNKMVRHRMADADLRDLHLVRTPSALVAKSIKSD